MFFRPTHKKITSIIRYPVVSNFMQIVTLQCMCKCEGIHFFFQNRSHAFKAGGVQAAKIILGHFHLEKWRGSTLLLLQSEPKTGGARALPAHSKTTPLYIQSRSFISNICFYINCQLQEHFQMQPDPVKCTNILQIELIITYNICSAVAILLLAIPV